MGFSVQIPLPKNDQDFEELCGHIYSVVLKDPLPKNNGRRGQKQNGVDVFVQKDFIQDKEHRIGIQCKDVKKLSFDGKSGDSVCAEIRKAEAGGAEIGHLLISTTLPNDARLTEAVQAYSDQRAQAKLFTVAIDFWEDISQKIRDNEVLLGKYSSTSDAAKLLLEQSRDYYNEGKYRLVIQCLEQPRISLDYLSPKQKATRLRLLALSYAHLGELAKIEDCLQRAIGLEPYSEETFKARIMIELLKHINPVVFLKNLYLILPKYPFINHPIHFFNFNKY